jgi:hypothetical protein
VPGGPSGTLFPIKEQKGKSLSELPGDDTYYLMAGFIQYDLE